METNLEHICCPYCGRDNAEHLLSENGFRAVKCKECGFVYVNPRPALGSIDEAAQTGMHEVERDNLNVIGRFTRRKVGFYEQRLRGLFPDGELSRKEIKWLDVGAGFGELLLAAKRLSAPGSVVKGIEPCRPKAQKAQEMGIAVTTTPLSEETDTYGYISTINVFSHLPDPKSFLVDLRDRLDPEAELVLVTGNGGDIPAEDFPLPLDLPDHLVFAGEQHLRNLLEDLGFSIVKINRYKFFMPESSFFLAAKNLVKRLIGKQPRAIPKESAFRSLFIRAKLRPLTERH